MPIHLRCQSCQSIRQTDRCSYLQVFTVFDTLTLCMGNSKAVYGGVTQTMCVLNMITLHCIVFSITCCISLLLSCTVDRKSTRTGRDRTSGVSRKGQKGQIIFQKREKQGRKWYFLHGKRAFPKIPVTKGIFDPKQGSKGLFGPGLLG